MATKSLLPLESNPDVMNKFLQKLGAPNSWGIVDVMGLDTDMLAWVPRPVASVVLLFPISEAYEEHKNREENEILSKGQEVHSDIFFMKQSLSNACGTIALVHSVANNTDKILLSNGPLKKFIDDAKNLDAAARGSLLEKNESIINAHVELALEGQTAHNAGDPVNHHFISFIHYNGVLYELDGRKPFPINHGVTTPDTLLEDAAKICKGFMAHDPDEVRFTVIALAACQ